MRRGWRLAVMVLLAWLASLLVIPPSVAAGTRRSMACREHTPRRAHRAAIAAITATPAGPRRDREIATWAQRIAAGLGCIAVVIGDEFGPEEIEVLARLHARVQFERGGAS